jgi:hypothetical protein
VLRNKERVTRADRRVLLAAVLAALVRISGCSGSAPARVPPPSPTPVPPTPVPATPTPVPDLFATVIRPAVRSHCSPCHEPGGRMYSRLPFDDPKVLISHSEGVLRRLQGENKEAFQRWLATVNPQN